MKKLILALIIALATSIHAGQIVLVFVGTTPGDGTGDPVYTAFQKVNNNFLLLTNLWNGAVTSNGVTAGQILNSFITHCTITNSTITNSTYAGNGHYLSNINSNSFDADTLAQLFSGGSYPDIQDIPGVSVQFNMPGQSLLMTPGTNDLDGNSPMVDFEGLQSGAIGGGLQFQGQSGGGPVPLLFRGYGSDANGFSVAFEGDSNVRFAPGYLSGSGTLSVAPADFGIDEPGYANGGFYFQVSSGYVGIGQGSPVHALDIGVDATIAASSFGNGNQIQVDDGGGNIVSTTPNGQHQFQVGNGTAVIQNGSNGSEIVLRLQSPDGTGWYLHVDNSGNLTATTSP